MTQTLVLKRLVQSDNSMRINFNRLSNRDSRRQILANLLETLCDEYDLDLWKTETWIKTKPGLDLFIRYLREKGYTVTAYSWPGDQVDPMSWGLEFDDEDPLVIELKIRFGNERDPW